MAVGVAVLFLTALLVFIVVMWGKADDPNNETAWARWTFLLSGVEAVAFAAAGWLFGREVHRAQAASAEERADRATNSSEAHMARAASAEQAVRDMSAAITAKRDAHAAERGAGSGDTASASVFAALDELATCVERMGADGQPPPPPT